VVSSGFLSVSVVSSIHEVEIKGGPAEALEEVAVGDGKVLRIGSQLDLNIRKGIVCFLHKNMDAFAWSQEDMLGIDPENIVHYSNTSPR
jgi:hypothetical protein